MKLHIESVQNKLEDKEKEIAQMKDDLYETVGELKRDKSRLEDLLILRE